MTNFDFLKQEPKFNSFSDVAIAAEKVLKIDKESSVINCRRAMEFAIKWMYSVDKSLEMPYQDNLMSLMSTEDFHDLVDDTLWKRLNLIRIELRTMVERLQKTRQFFVCRICLFLWIMCHTAILIFIKRDSMM